MVATLEFGAAGADHGNDIRSGIRRDLGHRHGSGTDLYLESFQLVWRFPWDVACALPYPLSC
jgi:hypothetical protein